MLALLYGSLLLLREARHVLPSLPDADSETMMSAALFYAAFYFLGKAVLVAHANTARFNASGKRLLGSPAMQWLIWEKNKDSKRSAVTERAAAERRRAVLAGEE